MFYNYSNNNKNIIKNVRTLKNVNHSINIYTFASMA